MKTLDKKHIITNLNIIYGILLVLLESDEDGSNPILEILKNITDTIEEKYQDKPKNHLVEVKKE